MYFKMSFPAVVELYHYMLFMAGSSGRLNALSGGKQSHLTREHQSTTVPEVMQRLLLMHMKNITKNDLKHAQ